ncbi:MAG: TrbI/VirB10 family protein [Gammaproteobacteria bacterium]|jgi:type IV secretory pathway VirB10-like protein
MSKHKTILLSGCLALLFLAMIFIELKNDETHTTSEEDDEVIYLSYQQEPPIANEPIREPQLQAVKVDPDLGQLALPSVIINKKIQTPLSNDTATSKDKAVEVSIAGQQQDLAFKVFQGHRFTAVLTHAINSDLPGMVVAEISQAVYGYQSYIPLLPKGTRLIGHYKNQLKTGDTRLYISWDRAITPTGIDIQLGSLATDRLGQSGMTGDVDSHFWEIFGTSALLSSMAVGASNLSSEQGEFSNQYQQAVTESLTDTSTEILSNRIIRKPTIHINQGEIIHVMVTKDLDFSKVLKVSQSIPIF